MDQIGPARLHQLFFSDEADGSQQVATTTHVVWPIHIGHRYHYGPHSYEQQVAPLV